MTENRTEKNFTGIFDSHAHYTDPVYHGILDAVLEKVQNAGISRILLASVSTSDSEAACLLAARYPFLYASVGVHPLERVPSADGIPLHTTDTLRALAEKYAVTAIGEIGLDYRYAKKNAVEISRQKDLFDAQLSLCEELHLPALVHSIDAAADTMDLLRSHSDVTGVMHGFCYSPEIAEQCLKLGWRIGIGTTLLNPKARRIREVLQMLPTDSILLESDCPFQPKDPAYGQPSDSSVLTDVAYEISRVRNEDPQYLTDRLTSNTLALLTPDPNKESLS